MEIAASVAAVALGASIVEKHLTLSRTDPGPDSAFSLEPDEFQKMVEAVRTVEKALGAVSFGARGKQESSKSFRRSLFVVEDIQQGAEFTATNIRSIRPGPGPTPAASAGNVGQARRQEHQKGHSLELAPRGRRTGAL